MFSARPVGFEPTTLGFEGRDSAENPENIEDSSEPVVQDSLHFPRVSESECRFLLRTDDAVERLRAATRQQYRVALRTVGQALANEAEAPPGAAAEPTNGHAPLRPPAPLRLVVTRG